MTPRRNEFSGMGEEVTELERAIAGEAMLDARPASLMVALAKRIGIDALVAVLDELGGLKVHIPRRREFFRQMYLPRRDAQLRELHASGRFSVEELAALFGMTRRNLFMRLRAAQRTTGHEGRATSARRG